MRALDIDRLGFQTGQTTRALRNFYAARGPSAVGPSAVKLASRALTNNNARAAEEVDEMGGNLQRSGSDKSRFGQTLQTDLSE